MKYLILFCLLCGIAQAGQWEVTVDLTAGHSIAYTNYSYYGDSYIGIVNVDAAYYVNEHVAGLIGIQHTSKLGTDTCNEGYCAGDNFGRAGLRLRW